MALAASGLLLFPMGVLMPVLRLQQMGHAHAASIWDGTVSLLSKGHYAVGLVVLVCSVILPIVKLTGLMLLCGRPPLPTRHAAALYRGVELAGKWGMIDVLLVAVLVASLKLGDVVEVQPGPGLAAFTACVVLSLLATGAFDPHGLWEPEPPGAEPARGG
jgi:paraquat-inducible protein A